MGERTQYSPGTFSWADLATTDQDGAKAFYSALFGWTAEDLPVGDGVSYSMMRLDGKDVAAIAPQPQQQRDAGAPPVWNSYVTVQSADAAAEAITAAGGTVHAPPFDVMDAGRMAVAQDPAGAFFMVWEARQNIGAALVNQPGALTWNELATPDVDGSQRFYGDVFGWSFEDAEGMPMRYVMVRVGEAGNGGIREPQPGEPPNWLVYFGTDDVDATLGKVEELGGSRMAGPLDIGVGVLGVAHDPQGAVFALYSGQFQE
jgi:predicted enzyme related to lactoylglutathione lyase